MLLLLVVECLLWLSDRLGWPAWHKGYAVLAAVAMLGGVFVLMLLWFLVALVFRMPFQFGIRSLLVFTVVVAVPSSWFAVEMNKATKQRSAKTAFRRFPGYIQYGYQRSGQLSASPAPSWLCRLLGNDFFASIEFVCLGCDKRFTDADMEHVKSLPRLKMLRLGGANITNAGLQHLAILTDLEDLGLGHTQVSDAGLEHIQGLTQLHRLGLYSTNVTDSGLKYLKGLGQLKVLYLGKTKVSDACLEPLQGLSQLEELDLKDTQVTEEGVKKLQQALPNCKIEG